MENIQINKTVAQEFYNGASKEVKKALETLIGKSALTGRPVGIWCLGVDNTATSIEKWDKNIAPLGVGVITEDAAFIVAPHASVALQWGAMDKAKSQLETDQESFDSETATDAMIMAYKGTNYADEDNVIWDVDGSPAAEWCRQYSNGDIGVGEWDLPAVAPLKLIYEHRDAINGCLRAIGGWKITNGYHWSSTAHPTDVSRALCVAMLDGYVNFLNKNGTLDVRAVSAFHFENFTFKS